MTEHQADPAIKARGHGSKTTLLAILLAVQVLCAVFFVGDVAEDFRRDGILPHTLFEGAVALALFIGVVLGGLEMRRTLERNRRAEAAASAASGAFAQLIDERFSGWALTAAEAEVALLALKGFDVAEIAGLRGTAEGTVRAQLARVYAKARVASRSQFVCLFIDDLLAAPITPEEAA